ncbi:MAG TPA: MarR family transcriptional regulator [Eubacteriaceae bacterium]|nr:MarR family transcriptional regulator [Eubacteriaceae bacterium]
MKRSIGRYVSILHRQSQIYINHVLKPYNITCAEYAFLLSLYRENGMSQHSLSSYLYIDKAATARAIKSLEEKGYVTRKSDEKDKRYKYVYLTDEALEIKDEVIDRIVKWSTFLTDDLDEETLDTLYDSLEHMIDKVENTELRKALEE